MSFVDSVRSVYTNYFKFAGRASRSEYWWFQLWLVLVVVAWLVIGIGLGRATSSSLIIGLFSLVILVVYLLSIIPSLAVICRRLHDSDHSGWWFWITLIPWVGALILLIFTVLPSTPGYNKYGPRPGEAEADGYVTYQGWTRSDALAQFAQDAQRAAASGYQPVHQEWQQRGNTEVLVVAYRRSSGAQGWYPPPGSNPPPWQGPS
jgi:uncharacterized membrane protein YhaH (DUF805 family)